MPEHDHDRSTERLLREAFATSTPRVDACADGETVAAWMEGTLPRDRASALEQHAATCQRCQALLAAFVRTAPAPEPAQALWRRWRLPWLVPLATAATAAALWFAIPGSERVPISPEPARGAASDSGTVQSPSAAVEPAPTVPADAPEASARFRAAPLPTPSQEQDVANAPGAGQLGSAIREAAEPDGSARRNEIAATSEKAADTNTLATRDATGNSAAGALVAARAESAPAAPPAAEPVQQRFEAREASSSILVSSAGSTTRWRITGRQVESSASGDTAWTPAIVNAEEDLLAGSSPSATVCWIVGRNGAVYLTTNGSRFDRLPFPERIDLTAVVSADARNATVTSADGRTWRTSDQGRTWTSGPQP